MRACTVGLWLAGAWAATVCRAQTIPSAWLRVAPGPQEAAAIVGGAERHGWPAMARALRAGALEAYGRGGWQAAAAWADAARWAGADAGPEPKVAGMGFTPPPVWLLADTELSAGYLALEKPEDDRATALSILGELRERAPAEFKPYASLALAIALVYDKPPPRDWPHWQVTDASLPRRLPAPRATFEYFVELDRSGGALHRLAELEASELRFLVDLAAPRDELVWVRGKIRTPLAKLDETYAAVRYRQDRIVEQAYVWPGATYTLDEILGQGGICVDQAYFATQAGKARGVPTLLFGGAGRDGRHAWFGYLGAGGRWRMDAGRYEDQRFVTGTAIDPQTWGEISDHELAFLSEGFRREKNAREAAIHARFAGWLLTDGKTREAETAARAAVRQERRELAGWDVLLKLRPAPGVEREAVAREAATGLGSYPELVARYMGVAIESLAARGETAEADRLGRELARRFAAERGDLSVAQVARQLDQAKAKPVEEQMRLYRSLLRRFGPGAGATMWDEVVRPFVARLGLTGHFGPAREALVIARSTLVESGGSQLEKEMLAAEKAIGAAEQITR